MVLLLVTGVVFASDTISVDTQRIGSIGELISGFRDLASGDLSFDAFYVYVTAAATFIIGVLRNLLPKWKWLTSLNLTSIPREVTVALAGLSVVLFILYSGVGNVDWKVLVSSVFGTMGVYSFVKSLIEKIPNLALRSVLLFLIGRFDKSNEAMQAFAVQSEEAKQEVASKSPINDEQ